MAREKDIGLRAFWVFAGLVFAAVGYSLLMGKDGTSPSEYEVRKETLKREKEYSIFCVANGFGEPGSDFKRGFLALKIKVKNVDFAKRRSVKCWVDELDIDFALKALSGESKYIDNSALNFSVPLESNGGLNAEIMMTATEYKYRSFDDSLDTAKEVCGLFKSKDIDGLYAVGREILLERAKGRLFSNPCNMVSSEDYFGILDDGEFVEFSCDENICLMRLKFKDWPVNVRFIRRSILNDWRAMRREVLEEIEKRLVAYVTEDECVGSIDCEAIYKGMEGTWK